MKGLTNNGQMVWIVFAARCHRFLSYVDDVNTSLTPYSVLLYRRVSLPLDSHTPAVVLPGPRDHFLYLPFLPLAALVKKCIPLGLIYVFNQLRITISRFFNFFLDARKSPNKTLLIKRNII